MINMKNATAKKSIVDFADVKNMVQEIAGLQGFKIVELLVKKKKIDEFKISSSLKLEVNFVRSLLYKLYSKKIVSYSKERDLKKGWWIYSWEMHQEKIKDLLILERTKELDKLGKTKHEKEGEQMYVCVLFAVAVNFSVAADPEFKCFSCGALLKNFDNTHVMNEIDDKIRRINTEIEEIKLLVV